MNPLAAIYHPGGTDPTGYPVSVVGFVSSWSEETGTVTQVVCVAANGSIRTFDADRVQVVDPAVATAIVTASKANETQRGQQRTVPPGR